MVENLIVFHSMDSPIDTAALSVNCGKRLVEAFKQKVLYLHLGSINPLGMDDLKPSEDRLRRLLYNWNHINEKPSKDITLEIDAVYFDEYGFESMIMPLYNRVGFEDEYEKILEIVASISSGGKYDLVLIDIANMYSKSNLQLLDMAKLKIRATSGRNNILKPKLKEQLVYFDYGSWDNNYLKEWDEDKYKGAIFVQDINTSYEWGRIIDFNKTITGALLNDIDLLCKNILEECRND